MLDTIDSGINLNLAGRVVLVTGGVRGVGAGISAVFAGQGATVVTCARRPVDGLPYDFHSCDVRDPDAVARLVGVITERHGRLDVLIHNAGGSPAVDAATVSPRFHEGVIRLNLTAALHMAQAANAAMQTQEQGGVIVFIGSVSALRPSPGSAAYGAAKAAVLSLASSLAVEWAPKVRVVAVSPGLVRTEQSHLHYGDAAGIAAVGASIPAGRMAEPLDIAQACLFVASPRAAYLSGTNLLLHGGGEKPAFLAAANAGQA